MNVACNCFVYILSNPIKIKMMHLNGLSDPLNVSTFFLKVINKASMLSVSFNYLSIAIFVCILLRCQSLSAFEKDILEIKSSFVTWQHQHKQQEGCGFDPRARSSWEFKGQFACSLQFLCRFSRFLTHSRNMHVR